MGKDQLDILINSNDDDFLKLLSNICPVNHLSFTAVNSRGEAIQLVKNNPPKIVILDAELDDLPWLDVIKEVKNVSPYIVCVVIGNENSFTTTNISIEQNAFTLHKHRLNEKQLLQTINYAFKKINILKALSHSDDSFFNFINRFQDGIAYVSMDGKIIGSNDAFKNMVGYSAEELEKLKFTDITPERWHAIEEKIVKEKIIAHGYSGLYEKEYRRKDGSIFPIEVSAFLTTDSSGQPESMWAFVRDVTDQKRSEQALRNQLQEVTILQNITAAGLTSETVDDLLLSATKILGDSRYQENFGVFIFDPKNKILHRHFTYRANIIEKEYENMGISVTDGITGRAARTRNPQRVGDVKQDKDYLNIFGDTRSEIAIPIIVNGEVFGVINSESPMPNRYTEEDEKLLITLANQLATSITKIKLNISEKQRAKEIKALYDTALATSSIMDTESLYQKIYTQVGGLFPLDTFLLVEFDDQDETIRIAFIMEEGKPLKDWLGLRFRKSESGLIGWVIQHRKPFLSCDLTADSLPVDSPATDNPARSWLGVPLITKGKVVGGLSVQAFKPNIFNENDQRLLESLAAQLAGAVENAQLTEKNRDQIERLQALHDIDLVINSSLDLHVILNILLDQVIEKLQVDAAVVLLYNPKTKKLEYTASRGFRTRAIESYQLHIEDRFTSKSAMEHHLVQALDLTDDEEFTYTGIIEEENFTSYYTVPLIAKGEVKGVLDIFNRTTLNPDQDWFNFLETLGGQAAIAIDNTGLLENLKQSNVDLREAYDKTLEGWSKALDLRDRETEGHTQRVVDMTLRIAEALGIPEKEQVHMRRGALLHDIGKMGIPDSILLKPGPLNEEEWEIMQHHPHYAYQLLDPIEHLKPALDIPFCHHERWDGTGYPRHLKGELIPIAGRIFAVVDVWDALISDRPYRKAWTSKKTLAYILKQRGEHFDPQIVDIFMKLIKSELIIPKD